MREENQKEATKREKRTKIRQKQLKRSSSKSWSNNTQNTRKTDPRDNVEVTSSTRPIDQRKIHENRKFIKDFKILYQNVRGLNSKIDALDEAADGHNSYMF